jgi:hypothetical protein
LAKVKPNTILFFFFSLFFIFTSRFYICMQLTELYENPFVFISFFF